MHMSSGISGYFPSGYRDSDFRADTQHYQRANAKIRIYDT